MKIPTEVQATVLIASRRRCCLCFGFDGDLARKKGQISHVDGDRTNNSVANLAYLCLDHHDELDSRTSQSKGITAREVRAYRDALVARLVETKSEDFAFMAADEAAGAAGTSSPAGMSPGGEWRLIFRDSAPGGIGLVGFFGEPPRLGIVKGRKSFTYSPGDRRLQLIMDATADIAGLQLPEEREWWANSGGMSVAPLGDGAIAVFDNRAEGERKEPEVITKHRANVTFGGFDRTGERFISADDEGRVCIWDWPARRIEKSFYSIFSSIVSVAFDSAENRLVAASRTGDFELFDLKTGRSLGTGEATVRGPSVHLWFGSDQKHIVAHDEHEHWDLFELPSLEPVPDDRWHEIVARAATDASQQRVLLLMVSGAVLAANLSDGALVPDSLDALPPFDEPVTDFDLSLSGRYAALVHNKQELRVWERASSD